MATTRGGCYLLTVDVGLGVGNQCKHAARAMHYSQVPPHSLCTTLCANRMSDDVATHHIGYPVESHSCVTHVDQVQSSRKHWTKQKWRRKKVEAGLSSLTFFPKNSTTSRRRKWRIRKVWPSSRKSCCEGVGSQDGLRLDPGVSQQYTITRAIISFER